MSFPFKSFQEFKQVRIKASQWRAYEKQLDGIEFEELVRGVLLVPLIDNRTDQGYEKRLYFGYKEGVRRLSERLQLDDSPLQTPRVPSPTSQFDEARKTTEYHPPHSSAQGANPVLTHKSHRRNSPSRSRSRDRHPRYRSRERRHRSRDRLSRYHSSRSRRSCSRSRSHRSRSRRSHSRRSRSRGRVSRYHRSRSNDSYRRRCRSHPSPAHDPSPALEPSPAREPSPFRTPDVAVSVRSSSPFTSPTTPYVSGCEYETPSPRSPGIHWSSVPSSPDEPWVPTSPTPSAIEEHKRDYEAATFISSQMRITTPVKKRRKQQLKFSDVALKQVRQAPPRTRRTSKAGTV